MLYIFDSTEKLIDKLPSGSFFDAVHREVLNGENTFQFTIPVGNEYVIEGNLVAFRDLDSYWQVFEIKRLVDLHGDGLTRTAFCEHILYELLDDIVIDKRPQADATAALAGMLENTRWQVGIVDDLGASSTSAYYESALSAVQKVANAWKGELNWRCVISGGVITRYVDLRAMVGTDTGKQFTYSKDILSIEREVDSSGVVTALYGRGKGIELDSGSYGRRLTFADVVAADKPAGQEWVGDATALAQWGRNGRHRFDVFIDEEETDPAALLEKTRAELARRKIPRVTYRLDVVSLEQLTGYEHEKVRLGDLVRVIDREFTPELVVSARVIEIERDLLDPANTKVVLGSFAPTIVEATINTQRRVDEMANRPFNTKWLDGKISVLQNAIESAMSNWWTDENGNLIFEAQDGLSAMKLAGEGFAIANQKNGDGTWNWRTFGNGSGFTADLMTTGILDAALVQIGHATTFEAGYDPTQITADSVGMGVDSDCVGLWHFDGSLNSHKGVSAIGDESFDTGCFGQAVKVTTPISGDISTGKESGMSASSMYNANYSPDNLVDGSIVFGAGTAFASASGETFPQWHQIDLGDTFSINKVRWINNRQTQSLPKDYTIAISETGAFAGEQTVVVTKTGNTTYNTWVEHTFAPIKGRYVRMTVSAVVSGTYYELAEWQIYGTRLGVLKAPTAGLSPSQGSIAFRAKNLSASANGSVLVDLPKPGKKYTNIFGTAGKGDTLTGWTNNGSLSTDGEWIYNNANSTGGGYLEKTISGSKYYFIAINTKTTATIDACRLSIVQFDNSNNALNYHYSTFNFPNMSSTAKRLGTKFQAESNAAKLRAIYIVNNSQVLYTKEYTLIEITADEYSNLTTEQLMAKYPFTPGTRETVEPTAIGCGISADAGHDGKIYLTDNTTTVYGPNKSTLTGWDSISLAYKSDRLSLVVNDSEACYIENPGLPTAFGSYLYIGTDRNGNNAINTLVDELRIDKVYREVSVRAGWHKTGVPFYTSEDMKQWPGYLRAETDGVKVYDSSNALRLLIGSWIRNMVRKYGIKIIDGEIYSTFIKTGAEGDKTYIAMEPPNKICTYKEVNGAAVRQLELINNYLRFWYDGDIAGWTTTIDDPNMRGKEISFKSAFGCISISGSRVYIDGPSTFYGDLDMGSGTKHNIEQTESYGGVKLAVRESPEQRYVDEGMGTLTNGECRIDVDPIFMECIEPHTLDSRWYIQLTPYADVDLYVAEIGDGYFVIKERKDGTTTGAEFTWSLSATRKDYAMIRFMEVFD